MVDPARFLSLSDDVRNGWRVTREMHASGHRAVVTVLGPMSGRAAMALAALEEGVPVTIFPSAGVKNVADWYSIEVHTSHEGLPSGSTLDARTTSVRVPTILGAALTRSDDHILVIHGIDGVAPETLNGLRGVLDDTMPQLPPAGPRVSGQTMIVLTADELSADHRSVLVGRLGAVIELT